MQYISFYKYGYLPADFENILVIELKVTNSFVSIVSFWGEIRANKSCKDVRMQRLLTFFNIFSP